MKRHEVASTSAGSLQTYTVVDITLLFPFYSLFFTSIYKQKQKFQILILNGLAGTEEDEDIYNAG